MPIWILRSFHVGQITDHIQPIETFHLATPVHTNPVATHHKVFLDSRRNISLHTRCPYHRARRNLVPILQQHISPIIIFHQSIRHHLHTEPLEVFSRLHG